MASTKQDAFHKKTTFTKKKKILKNDRSALVFSSRLPFISDKLNWESTIINFVFCYTRYILMIKKFTLFFSI